MAIEIYEDDTWQMTFGERAALEGLLTQVKPKLSIETGTAEGGSLRRIAKHSKEVHAFDIVEEVADLGKTIKNANFHIGDSGVLLPQVLEDFAKKKRHVDFAMIDGDHTFEGVKRDALAVVNSDACRRTVILFHDGSNEVVRAGIEAADLANHPKVGLYMLDFVPGYLVRKGTPSYSLAAWNGLGLVILDPDATSKAVQPLHDRYSVAEIYEKVRPLYDGGSPAGSKGGFSGRVKGKLRSIATR